MRQSNQWKDGPTYINVTDPKQGPPSTNLNCGLISKWPRSENTPVISHFSSSSKIPNQSSNNILARLFVCLFFAIITVKTSLEFQRGFEQKARLISFKSYFTLRTKFFWTIFSKSFTCIDTQGALRKEKRDCLSILVLFKADSLHEQKSGFSKELMGPSPHGWRRGPHALPVRYLRAGKWCQCSVSTGGLEHLCSTLAWGQRKYVLCARFSQLKQSTFHLAQIDVWSTYLDSLFVIYSKERLKTCEHSNNLPSWKSHENSKKIKIATTYILWKYYVLCQYLKY